MTEEKPDHWEWCRAFIDHNCIFRSPPGQNLLLSPEGDLNAWQYFLPIALLNQEFARRVAKMFWDQYLESFKEQQFQLCGCESGGGMLVPVLQSYALHQNAAVNGFLAKKEPKKYGLKNWYEGIVLPDVPVLLIDDVVASKRTLLTQAKRLLEHELVLYSEAFSIVACKMPGPLVLDLDGKSIDVRVFYKPEDFTVSPQKYALKYEKNPIFPGITV